MRFIALDSEETFKTVRGVEVGLVFSRLALSYFFQTIFQHIHSLTTRTNRRRVDINCVPKCWSTRELGEPVVTFTDTRSEVVCTQPQEQEKLLLLNWLQNSRKFVNIFCVCMCV
jgi:hypothetical protein